jgi:hypothetical protein
MSTPIFKIGDTIKVVSRLKEDDGTPINISTKTIRSVLKRGEVEIVGTVSLLDNFTVQSLFDTTAAEAGKHQTDIRFTEGTESFATPTVVIEIVEKVS